MHVAVAPVPESMQLLPNVPVPLDERAKVAVGVIAVPGDVSVTVTVHCVAVFTATDDGMQETDVVVVRTVTVTAVLLELPEWFVSPLKVAVRV